jgi:hypothetical protein
VRRWTRARMEFVRRPPFSSKLLFQSGVAGW